MADNNVIVSVVIPVRNEERYIKRCIDSILLQSYSKENYEIIFVDGASEDKTCDIINEFIKQNGDLIKLYSNPDKTVPYAMNIGIKNSSGKYIIRLDAHSEYSKDYFEKCVYYLDTTDADNVGGRAIAESSGYVGNAISYMLSSKFGVGNSSFRTENFSGYVDTVPFGAFRRETFEKYGYYDERLTRNQDIELNSRINNNGGKVYLSSDIILKYHNRDTFKGLAKQGFNDGKWNIITFFLCKGTMSVRHFIPFLFVLSLIFMPVLIAVTGFSLFKLAFIAELSLYLLLDIAFSVMGAKKNSLKFIFILPILYPFYHIVYGTGSLCGLFAVRKFKK